jgi:hypothetical protein
MSVIEQFGPTFTANGVWVGFDGEPTIKDIQEARRLLDQLTDDLIRKAINDE